MIKKQKKSRLDARNSAVGSQHINGATFPLDDSFSLQIKTPSFQVKMYIFLYE